MKRGLIAFALAVFLSGCRGAGPIVAAPPSQRQPMVPPVVIPADANFLLMVSEAIASPEDDVLSYTKVFIDGQPAGQTPIAAKSKEKAWGDVLAAGNHLFRFEGWVLPLPGEWTPLAAQWQPPERFIRIEPGQHTGVALKFFDAGRRHSLRITREPSAAPVR